MPSASAISGTSDLIKQVLHFLPKTKTLSRTTEHNMNLLMYKPTKLASIHYNSSHPLHLLIRGYNGEFGLVWGPFIDIERAGGGRSAMGPARSFPSGIIFWSEMYSKQLKRPRL